jgi:transcriptional regulator with XRE-family HTH domain
MAGKAKKSEALDQHIGTYLRRLRESRGLTQTDLAQKAGVSYQQIHKYENGSNRISAGRLGLFAEILDVPVQSFYDGMAQYPAISPDVAAADRLCLEMARHFRRIDNPRYQEAVHLLVRILAH